MKKWTSLAVACLLLLSLAVLPAAASLGQCRIVTVGYFDFPGYHNRAENGEKSGYGYEYLQELRKYANWRYEYVYAPYEECLALLAAGKIDLLTSVSHSPERDRLFDFSEAAMGTKDSIVTVRADDKRYLAGEYAGFDGLRVGLLSGNSSNEKFRNFAQQHAFSYRYDDSYASVDALCAALQDGTADAIVTSNLRKTQNERVVAEFSPAPYYAAVKAGDSELLRELNIAMGKFSIASHSFQSALYQKYYGGNTGSIALSPAEEAYIRSHPALSVLVPPSYRPMAYSENGIAQGIVPDLLRKALEPSGFLLKLTSFSSTADYVRARADSRKNPVVGLTNDNIYQAEANNLRLTASYLTINYNVVTKAGAPAEPFCLAAVRNEPVTENYIEKHYPAAVLRYYNNNQECLEALLKGEATHVIMNSFIAEYVIQNDVKHRLVSNIIADYHTDFAISVDNDADYLLFSILNKCVNALSPDDVRSILMENTLYRDSGLSLVEYLYLHPGRVIAMLLTFFALLSLVVVLIARQQRLKKERGSLEETAQFARLTAEAMGNITELNLDASRATSYAFFGKELRREEQPLTADRFALYEARVHPDQLAEYRSVFSPQSLQELGGHELQRSCSLRIRTAEGDYHWTLFTLQGILADDTHPNNLIIFEKNMDELKRTEELRRQQLTDALNTALAASDAKGSFMSRMSHEIRTPLNAILGYMAIAKRNAHNPDKMNDCLCKAEISAGHLLGIINDVLDMSSIESGKLQISQERFDLRALLQNLSTVFSTQSEAKQLHFTACSDELTENFLMGDRLRVSQVLMNLLSNAVKFTPAGGSVSFRVTQSADKGDKLFLKFIVEDSGIGMTEDYLRRLFTPFEQQDASIAQKYGGSGLGLSITKNLVSMMNGSIAVVSAPDEGSSFTVELPFARDCAAKSAAASQAAAPCPPIGEGEKAALGFAGKRLLLAEDNAMNREIASDLLGQQGFLIDCAENGQEAVDAFLRAPEGYYAAILMDIQMPLKNGYEATGLIRASAHPQAGRIPILAMTANAFSEDIAASHAAGMDDHISKPIDMHQLLTALQKYIG